MSFLESPFVSPLTLPMLFMTPSRLQNASYWIQLWILKAFALEKALQVKEVEDTLNPILCISLFLNLIALYFIPFNFCHLSSNLKKFEL